jgi:photosystem II stability/assembly factor-like uncharacterized protein
MSASGQYQSAVVNPGSIWYSSNYGINWTVISNTGSNPSQSSWNSICMSASGQYQSAGEYGNIWYSSNYGVNWTVISNTSPNPNRTYWRSICMSASGQYQSAVEIGLDVNGGNIWYSVVSYPDIITSNIKISNLGTATTLSSINISTTSLYANTISTMSSGVIVSVLTGVKAGNGIGVTYDNANNATISSLGVVTIASANNLIGVQSTSSGAVTLTANIPGTTNVIYSNSTTTGVNSLLQLANSGNFQIQNTSSNTIMFVSTTGVKCTTITQDASVFADKSAMVSATPSLDYNTFGVNWTQVSNTPSTDSKVWLSICMSASGQYQSAVINNSGNIWYSSNYGVVWIQSSSPSKYWQSICMSASGQYQSAVAYGDNIWYSSNYGVSWTQCDSSTNSKLWWSICMSASGQYQSAVVQGGKIWYSSNFGINWTEISNSGSNPSPSNWNSICMSASGQYQSAVVVYNGNIWYSSNYGVNWTQSSAPLTAWQSICMSASGQYQSAVANGSVIYYSRDYGINWAPSLSSSMYWYSICMSASGQYQSAVVFNGNIWYSSNYGVDWIQSSSPSTVWQSICMSASGQYQSAVVNPGNIWYSVVSYPQLKTSSIYLTGTMSTTGTSVYINNGIIGTTNASDQSLKTNISSLANQLSIVSQLNPVSFNWLSNTSKTSFGFVAQEIDAILPNICDSIPNTFNVGNSIIMGYDPVSLIPVLTGSIKELSTIVSTQVQEISTLTSNNSTCNAQLQQILTHLNLNTAS